MPGADYLGQTGSKVVIAVLVGTENVRAGNADPGQVLDELFDTVASNGQSLADASGAPVIVIARDTLPKDGQPSERYFYVTPNN